ncbi:MAG: dihydroxy-acid dehydratase [Candidatus Aminicenantes bacterium]|nr:dihydroxy-acid dehydratase [Candidatus Aminicenantes bacterium]
MEDRKIKEILIEKNHAFKKLFLEHQDLEEKLQANLQKKFKNEEERIEEKNIKKRKLKLKDAMQKHICEFNKKLS